MEHRDQIYNKVYRFLLFSNNMCKGLSGKYEKLLVNTNGMKKAFCQHK